MKNLNNKSGITLIALIITIIVSGFASLRFEKIP